MELHINLINAGRSFHHVTCSKEVRFLQTWVCWGKTVTPALGRKEVGQATRSTYAQPTERTASKSQ